ncbi:MAG: stage II sporulation protein D [Bacillota bacterium]
MGRYFLWGTIILLAVIVIIPVFVLLVVDYDSEVEIKDMERPINVYNYQTQKLMQLDFEDYIAGVVAAEMPASFDSEALKVQAVAARTYAYKRLLEADPAMKQYHPQADITTNPGVSQAWTGDDEMKEKWGRWDYAKYKKKIEKAVKDTKGEILAFENKIIDPVYHASCGGGKTEDSGDVWKYSFPYLKSVDCIEHQDKHIRDTKTIPIKNIDVALGSNLQAVPASKLQGSTNQYIKVLDKTSTGRIKSISIGGKTYQGTEVRTKLGLKSTWFSWEISKDTITFITRGYGHAVGMCQYGADAFAKEGKKYDEILKHYYQGAQIIKMK